MTEEKGYLGVPDVARIFGLHEESVRRMVREGQIPAFKAGRNWRFDPKELELWRQKHRSGTKGRRILVVDDSEDIRDVIRITLEDAGHDVVLAATGQGAITALRSRLPELVLLDLKMPHGSGVDVLEEVRRQSADLPVIIITGYPDSDLMYRALTFSPLHVLAKPIDPEVLLHELDRALAR